MPITKSDIDDILLAQGFKVVRGPKVPPTICEHCGTTLDEGNPNGIYLVPTEAKAKEIEERLKWFLGDGKPIVNYDVFGKQW